MSTHSAVSINLPAARRAEARDVPTGAPAAVGWPALFVGSVALGLTFAGYLPTAAGAAPIAIIVATTGVGLAIATTWVTVIGESAVARILLVLSAFWLSYAALVLGLTHAWFTIPVEAAVRAQGLFLMVWLVVVGVLTTAGARRSPFAVSAPFFRMDLALVVVLVGTVSGSADWLKLGSWLVFLFAAVGVFLYIAPRPRRR